MILRHRAKNPLATSGVQIILWRICINPRLRKLLLYSWWFLVSIF